MTIEGLVASSTGIEQRVSVDHNAEEDGQSPFCLRKPLSMVGAAHLFLLREGRPQGPPFYLMPNSRNIHLAAFPVFLVLFIPISSGKGAILMKDGETAGREFRRGG